MNNTKGKNTSSFGSLDLNPAQQFKHFQQLMMSKQMQQAIAILQLPVLELSSVIFEELEQNPILECEEMTYDFSEELQEPLLQRKIGEELNDSYGERELGQSHPQALEKATYIENFLPYQPSLFEYLMKQAHEIIEASHLKIAEWLIGNIDEFGFLSLPLEELAAIKNYDLALINKVLSLVQSFEPSGIGAKNLQESLLIQLKQKNKKNSLAYQIIAAHYQEMIHHKIVAIAKSLKVTPREIQTAIEKDIACLDLHPALTYSSCIFEKAPSIIVPDLFIRKEAHQVQIEVNEENIPSLKISSNYLELLQDQNVSSETRHYIQNKIDSGKWLLKSIEQRHTTLYRIAKEMVDVQQEFLFTSSGQLKPLTMRIISEKLSLNESTVARAIANKYVDCPKGVLSLRSFFTHGFSTSAGHEISSTTVKELVKEIIASENPSSPFSDETISQNIQKKGISCARRTVAKYRSELGIGSASQRKAFR